MTSTQIDQFIQSTAKYDNHLDQTAAHIAKMMKNHARRWIIFSYDVHKEIFRWFNFTLSVKLLTFNIRAPIFEIAYLLFC